MELAGIAIETLFVFWIVFMRGADEIKENSFWCQFVHPLAGRWNADGIKIYVIGGWIATILIYFILN